MGIFAHLKLALPEFVAGGVLMAQVFAKNIKGKKRSLKFPKGNLGEILSGNPSKVCLRESPYNLMGESTYAKFNQKDNS